MMVAYLARAEFYAEEVRARRLSMSEACQRLSAETSGGLTPLGAADVIADPVRYGVQLGNLFDEVRLDYEYWSERARQGNGP